MQVDMLAVLAQVHQDDGNTDDDDDDSIGDMDLPRPLVEKQKLVLRMWRNLLYVLGNINETIVRGHSPAVLHRTPCPADGLVQGRILCRTPASMPSRCKASWKPPTRLRGYGAASRERAGARVGGCKGGRRRGQAGGRAGARPCGGERGQERAGACRRRTSRVGLHAHPQQADACAFDCGWTRLGFCQVRDQALTVPFGARAAPPLFQCAPWLFQAADMPE